MRFQPPVSRTFCLVLIASQHLSAGLLSSVRCADSFVRHSKLLVTLFLIAVLLATAAAQKPTPTPTPPDDVDVLRTETDLTNLLFTATDKSNRYVTTLQQNDIRVIEDGVPQSIFTVQRETGRPPGIAVLIDVSSSQERMLPVQDAPA